MLRKALLISALFVGAASLGACSDDDFGQERPPADAAVELPDGDAATTPVPADSAVAVPPDLLPLPDLTPADLTPPPDLTLP